MVDFRDGRSSRVSDVLCSIWPRRMAWGPCLSPAQGPLLSQRSRLRSQHSEASGRPAGTPVCQGPAGFSLAAPGAPTPALVPMVLTFLICDRQATQ